MPAKPSELGRLISVHGTAPLFLQRAAIVAVLSLLFFLAALLFFYMQRSIGYFIVSSAFLIVYIFTMIGWVMQKRNTVSIYADGILYREFVARWDELKSVRADNSTGITIVKTGGESITIDKSVADVDKIAVAIRKRLG